MESHEELVRQRVERHERDKALVPRYVAAANVIADRYEMIHEGSEYITVGNNPHVHQTEVGAYVEVIIWVPKEQL